MKSLDTSSNTPWRLGPLPLKNPLVVASSPATEDFARLRRCADAGAGAAILKSCHTLHWRPSGDAHTGRHFQMTKRGVWGTSTVARELLSPTVAMDLLKSAHSRLNIPVIPSIAGATLDPGPWIETLQMLEPFEPGCVQLDLFYVEDDVSLPKNQQRLRHLVQELRRCSHLPLLPKLNQELRPGAAVEIMGDAEICGWSLLDSLRFCVPQSGVSTCGTFPAFSCSTPSPTASLFGSVQLPHTVDYLVRVGRASKLPILAGGGVINARDCSLLLAMGASAVQVAMPILEHGETWISDTVEKLSRISRCEMDTEDVPQVLPLESSCRHSFTMCTIDSHQMMCGGHEGQHGAPYECEKCGYCQLRSDTKNQGRKPAWITKKEGERHEA